jgi:hypothetical protein
MTANFLMSAERSRRVAILPTMMAAPITSAGRFSPLGPLGIVQLSHDSLRAVGNNDDIRAVESNHGAA